MNKKWILAVAALVITIAIVGFIFLKQRSSTPLATEATQGMSQADLQMEGLEYVQTRDGAKEWVLSASSAHFLKTQNEADLENVRITFYPKNGGEVVMTSEKGRFNTSTQDIQAWGNVHVESEDGYEFTTSAVNYQAQTRVITSDQQVFFSGPQFQVEGRGLKIELESGKLNILNQVSATIWGDMWKGAQSS
jgi:LPS export ABC transporter protein LptC